MKVGKSQRTSIRLGSEVKEKGHSRSIHRKEVGWDRRKEGVSGFVDAEFEGHSARKLVSLVVCGDVDGVDSAFHVHLHIGGHVQELHGHEGLCVVHVELLAIVGEVHEVDVAIGREHDKATQILGIFISLPHTGNIHALVCSCIEVDDPVHLNEDTGLPSAITIVGGVPDARAVTQLGPVELAGTFRVVEDSVIWLFVIAPRAADIILLGLDGVVVRLQELVELLNMLVPAFSVTDIDDDIKVLSLGANHQAWCGQSVLVLGGVVRDSLQHHPHGEGEHGREEAIEDEVEEEDKGPAGPGAAHELVRPRVPHELLPLLNHLPAALLLFLDDHLGGGGRGPRGAGGLRRSWGAVRCSPPPTYRDAPGAKAAGARETPFSYAAAANSGAHGHALRVAGNAAWDAQILGPPQLR